VNRDVGGRPALDLENASEDAQRLAALSGANIGRKMVLVAGDRVLSAPVVRSAFGKYLQITLGANSRPGELEELATSLRAAAANHR
jgi:preprotein translocase subunit SecD